MLRMLRKRFVYFTKLLDVNEKLQSLFFQSHCTLTKYVKSHNVISFFFGQTKHFGIQGYTYQLSM